MKIYNSSPKHEAHICMSRVGVDKTIRKYKDKAHEVSPETKRSLFYLDELLKNATYSNQDPPKERKENIDHLDTYYINYRRAGKLYETRIVVFVYKPGHGKHQLPGILITWK